MDVNYYLVKPIINGFEVALFFSADNADSVGEYIKRFLNVPVSISAISKDDFQLFGNSGFKFYAVPPQIVVNDTLVTDSTKLQDSDVEKGE